MPRKRAPPVRERRRRSTRRCRASRVAQGTHEYECTNCGYVLFPAAGREFKFFGADFTCPGCGAGKDAFVDNGPVE